MALVKEDAVDLALVYAPVEDGELDVHVDTRQPLDLIIPANHALAGHRGAVPMRALRNESLALIHNSTGMGQLAVIAAQLERIELRPKLRTNSVAVLTNFVKSGIGVAFMPELTVSHEIEAGHIRCLPLAHPALRDARPRADRQPQGPRADRGGDRLPGTPAPRHALLQWRRARALAALRRCLFRITSGLE